MRKQQPSAQGNQQAVGCGRSSAVWRRRARVGLGALVAGALFGCQSTAPLDGSHDVPVGFGGMKLRVDVESVRQIRFHDIVPQALDYSCGAAALATLLKYHYDDPVRESEIILEMIAHGDEDKIRREGFSLLDLKRFADRRGYETQGFRIGPKVLERLAIPAITLVSTRGYSHFVVLKGARNGMVYLADPAMGQRNVPKEEFVAEWENVVFFVAAQRKGGRASALEQLSSLPQAPIEMVRDLDLLRYGVRAPFAVREF